MFKPSMMSVPDGSCFPCAAAVHDHHGGILKSRVTVSADGVCEVVIDVPHARFYVSKLIGEAFRTALLMPHADEMQTGIQYVQIIQWHFAGCITLQVMPICRSRMGPTEAHLVQFSGLYARKIQACTDRVAREACIVFDSADAFFRDRKQQFTIAHNACG